MRWVVLGLGLWALPAAAQDWQMLDGAAIAAALTSRVLAYEDGTLQDFFGDGRTLLGETLGRWKVDGDLYCEAVPDSAAWTCAGVEREARGLDLRFTREGGSVAVGRYVDLQ